MISVSLGYFSLISLNIGVLRTTVFLEAESYNGFFFKNQTVLTEIIILELQCNIAAFSVNHFKTALAKIKEKLRFGIVCLLNSHNNFPGASKFTI